MQNYKLAVLILLLAIQTLGQATSDKWLGVWKLNLAARTLKFESAAGGIKAASDLTDAEGTIHIEFTARYDGKDVVMNGPALRQTIAVTRIDAYNFETVQKSGGTVTSTGSYVVSRDGKTLTVSVTSVVASGGEKVTNVSVYDKQP
jgi:hypothetical protein